MRCSTAAARSREGILAILLLIIDACPFCTSQMIVSPPLGLHEYHCSGSKEGNLQMDSRLGSSN